MNKNIDSIIFDLDGTLWDTVDCAVQTLEEIKNKYEDITKTITADEVKSAMGKVFDEIVEIYYGYLPEEKATLYTKEAFEKNVDNLLKKGGKLYDNTENTIIELTKKYKLFIVSNCIDGYIESFIKTSKLGKYFTDYECIGRTNLSKGENIRLVIERNNLKNSVYVGDTLKDKEAADFAEIPFVFASYGFGNVNEYVYKLDDIKDLLEMNI